jgi:hypothetical protein
MAQHYSRGPPTKSRGAIEDNWQAPSHQSHRAGGGGGGYAGGNPAIPSNVAPNAPPNIAMAAGGVGMGGPPQPPPLGATRLNEIIEALRQEYDGILHDNSSMKGQREEFENQGKYIRII